MPFKEQYLIDQIGKLTAVLIDIEYYQRLLDALEEVESLRAYDIGKASNDVSIPFAQAFEEIERNILL